MLTFSTVNFSSLLNNAPDEGWKYIRKLVRVTLIVRNSFPLEKKAITSLDDFISSILDFNRSVA